MNPKVKGLHHITVISGDPTRNARFYVNKLGLRMVKKTVNHDAPETYHLFYGDGKGTPGSSITFFPEMAQGDSQTGAGQVTELGLRIPEDSVDYWTKRLEKQEIDHKTQEWQGRKTLSLEDDSGLSLRLVPGETDLFTPWKESSVPEQHQIRGMHHVELSVKNAENTSRLLEEISLEKKDGIYVAEDGSKVLVTEKSSRGKMGEGTVHHIAFKVEDEKENSKFRDKLQRIGLRPSPQINRKYFSSVYFREPGGVLFEFATMGEGYTADEDMDKLGESLVLPDELEDKRKEIEQALPDFREEEIG